MSAIAKMRIKIRLFSLTFLKYIDNILIKEREVSKLNKVQKIKNVLKGDDIEGVAFGFWTHLPGIDLDPVRLAEETYKFYKKYDIDFVKTMNNGMYAIEDYGCEIDYSEVEKGGVAKLIHTPINGPEDWIKVNKCDLNSGALKRELDSLKLLKEKINGEAPIIFTVFSPITIAAKLSKNLVFDHIKEGYSELVEKALVTITENTKALVNELKRLDVDGIFFAAQSSSYDVTDLETYETYGKPYDLEILNEASDMWFNVIHAHGNNIMFKILREYPVDVFNWHGWETLPEIKEAQIATKKTIMTGVSRMDITNSNLNELSNQIYKTIKETQGKKIILTPGCVIRHPLNENTLNFVKSEIEYWYSNIVKEGK